jgi:hypothetical protein
MANILLTKRGTTPIQIVRENWVSKFIKQHNELKTHYTQHYDYQQAKCEDPKIIREWFNCVQITII